MQEIFARLPQSLRQQPAVMGGQIFAISYQQPVVQERMQEENQAVPATDTLNALQVRILEELAVYQHATADLLLRILRMKPGSLRHLQKQIYAMYSEKPENRYVEFLYPPKQKATRYGSSPYVVTLGRKGYKFLRKQGRPVGRYRDQSSFVHTETTLRHRLAVNEFLLKAQLLETELIPEIRDTQLTLHMFVHEKTLNANPLKVRPRESQKAHGLSPDLVLAYETLTPPDQYWLLPEINLSEPWRKDWEAKVRLYRYCMPAYRERFGTSVLTTIPVMVASKTSFPRRVYGTFTDEDKRERELEAIERHKRMMNLRKWTEGMLDELKMRKEADLFSFSCAPLDELSPTELFFGKHWIIPFDDTPRSLLPLRKAGGK
jgi:hypothetical protein